MIKVGDKVMVKCQVTQVIEDKHGVKYTVEALDDGGLLFMRVPAKDVVQGGEQEL